uniref:Uncharacterized protein n=1 Tax=Timema bartmani TaxID=61472 RepID=A0A7R9EWM3_9NEOP|nr:unnamed protein product [Timema bartmani]
MTPPIQRSWHYLRQLMVATRAVWLDSGLTQWRSPPSPNQCWWSNGIRFSTRFYENHNGRATRGRTKWTIAVGEGGGCDDTDT